MQFNILFANKTNIRFTWGCSASLVRVVYNFGTYQIHGTQSIYIIIKVHYSMMLSTVRSYDGGMSCQFSCVVHGDNPD